MGVFFVLGLVTFRLPDNIAYVHGKALAALYSQLEGGVLHAIEPGVCRTIDNYVEPVFVPNIDGRGPLILSKMHWASAGASLDFNGHFFAITPVAFEVISSCKMGRRNVTKKNGVSP